MGRTVSTEPQCLYKSASLLLTTILEWRCLRPEHCSVFMRQDMPEGWRKFHIEELHYFRSSDKIKEKLNGRSLEEMRSALVGNQKERDHLKDPDIDVSVI